jgi:hypothetical protein
MTTKTGALDSQIWMAGERYHQVGRARVGSDRVSQFLAGDLAHTWRQGQRPVPRDLGVRRLPFENCDNRSIDGIIVKC